MPNQRGPQRRRQERRENKRVELLTDVNALRAARERLMVETSPMANMPDDRWERDVWGLCDD